MTCRHFDKTDIEQLEQLWTPTWDGDLISKSSRDKWVEAGSVQRAHGFNWLTADGIISVQQMWLLRKDERCKL